MPQRASHLCSGWTLEVRLATWEEVKGDTWVIPASRMKAGKEHRVPLCARALEILEDMPRTSSDLRNGRWVVHRYS